MKSNCDCCGASNVLFFSIEVRIGYEPIGYIEICASCLSRIEKKLVKKFECTQPAIWKEVA